MASTTLTTSSTSPAIQQYFQLSSTDEVKNYLYSTEVSSYLGSIANIVSVELNRFGHYLYTGQWINVESCLSYCMQEGLRDQKQIQQLFNKTVAQQFPEYNAAAGPLFNPPTTLEVIIDKLQFIKRFILSPSTIGSLFPSSSGLTAQIIRQIPDFDANDGPKRYLEIGAGTGVFTEQLIRKLKATDTLVIVEFDHDMCDILRRKFEGMQNVTIHEMSILDFTSTEKFDVTVSGLPLNAFSSQFVEQVLHKYKEVTKEGGFVSYFEYMGLEKIKQCFLCGDHYTDFNRVLSLKERFVTDYGTETDNIWLNMTPARVRHCQMPVQATA